MGLGKLGCGPAGDGMCTIIHIEAREWAAFLAARDPPARQESPVTSPGMSPLVGGELWPRCRRSISESNI